MSNAPGLRAAAAGGAILFAVLAPAARASAAADPKAGTVRTREGVGIEGEEQGAKAKACRTAFTGSLSQIGTLHKQTSPPGADPSAGPPYPIIAPGQAITVTLTLGGADDTRETGDDGSIATDCVEINGVVRDALAGSSGSADGHEEEGPARPSTAAGTSTATYTVPIDTVLGAVVCDRGLIPSIPSKSHPAVAEKSNVVCFTVGIGAMLPEAPWPAALPLGAGVVGGALLVVRRRRGRDAHVRAANGS